ncbi:MAG: hypothetical protein ABIP94_07645 [Planctomycetota bacterium]
MLFTRKIGAVLRGKATPFQVMLATTLGGLLGFLPGFFLPGDLGGGFLQAPGLILLLTCLVLVLNANLAVFGLVTLVAKMLSLMVLPASYSLGTFLLDGPLQGLFRGLVNGKVTAWFGLEYYATVGGLIFGLIFGLASGWLLNRTIRAIRLHMANAEENSERYQKYAKKWWVRLSTWLLLGKGKGKKSWAELAEQKKFGMPIRISGVLVAAVLVGSGWVFQTWFSTPILTSNVKSGLQAMNGATVDLRAARLDLGAGVLRFEGFAMADSKALDKDLLAADTMTATLDTGELLRKRFVIDELRSTNARGGSKRVIPGVIVPGATKPAEPPAPPAGTSTIEDYLKDFEVWKARLEQARDWIEVITGGDETPPGQQTPEQREKDRAEQERVKGIASVVATHLIEGGPRVLIRKIDFEGIGYSIGGKAEKIDLRARNVSDLPSLVAEALTVSIKTQSDSMLLHLSGKTQASPALGFEFAFRQLPVDSIFGQLKIGGQAPLRGGTIDLSSKGLLTSTSGQAMSLDFPLQVAIKDTVFALAGAKETKVESLLLPIGLRGSVTSPAVSFDDKVLRDALLAAGKQELANFVQQNAGKLLGGLPKEVSGLIDVTKPPDQIVDEAKQKLEVEKKRLEEEAKKKAVEEAKKRLRGLIPGGG